MNANLLTLAQEALGGDFTKLASQDLGESSSSTQLAVASLLPAVLGTVAQKGATPEGASGLLSLINGAKLDVNSLGNIAGLFGGGSGMNDLLKAGTGNLYRRCSATRAQLWSTRCRPPAASRVLRRPTCSR